MFSASMGEFTRLDCPAATTPWILCDLSRTSCLPRRSHTETSWTCDLPHAYALYRDLYTRHELPFNTCMISEFIHMRYPINGFISLSAEGHKWLGLWPTDLFFFVHVHRPPFSSCMCIVHLSLKNRWDDIGFLLIIAGTLKNRWHLVLYLVSY